jgi:hypothetical protein
VTAHAAKSSSAASSADDSSLAANTACDADASSTEALTEATKERVTSVFAALEGLDPKWRVELGRPQPGDGWISGDGLRDARTGLFQALLTRMHERAKTDDRKTMAASFALRIGWAGAVAIAPYLTHRVVPHVGLDNVSIKFKDTTLYERTAVHAPHGWETCSSAARASSAGSNDLRSHGASSRDARSCSGDAGDDEKHQPDAGALLRRLRRELAKQAEPIVRALQDWSGFTSRGSWGMITSSWAAQFITVSERLGGQALAAPILEDFFAGNDDIGRMQPRVHAVTMEGVTHLYQRRASCCRYYLLPQGNLCASCPLVSHDERLRRNREFMANTLRRLSSQNV